MNLTAQQQINQSFFPATGNGFTDKQEYEHEELTAPEVLDRFREYNLDSYFLKFLELNGLMEELFSEVKMDYIRYFRGWFQHFAQQTKACPDMEILRYAATISAFEFVKGFYMDNERRVFEINRTIREENKKIESKLRRYGDVPIKVKLENHSGDDLLISYQPPKKEETAADPVEEYMDISFLEYLSMNNKLERCMESIRLSGREYCQQIYGGYVKLANRKKKKVLPFEASIRDLQVIIASGITYPELREMLDD